MSQDCPNVGGDGRSKSGCFKYGEDGHVSQDCKNPDREVGRDVGGKIFLWTFYNAIILVNLSNNFIQALNRNSQKFIRLSSIPISHFQTFIIFFLFRTAGAPGDITVLLS
ncbi:uncharacterized protein LOC143249014 isoform X2 [Tachypleus tridentatus]|uniref:uncharacterized protein LOC143249014 isoform X2 n=1 Tax=Tachypleus tridentatus TaxID=6853 RepID=UPI003FD05F81